MLLVTALPSPAAQALQWLVHGPYLSCYSYHESPAEACAYYARCQNTYWGLVAMQRWDDGHYKCSTWVNAQGQPHWNSQQGVYAQGSPEDCPAHRPYDPQTDSCRDRNQRSDRGDCAGNPIRISRGFKTQYEMDYRWPLSGFEFGRHYHSRPLQSPGESGWREAFSQRLRIVPWLEEGELAREIILIERSNGDRYQWSYRYGASAGEDFAADLPFTLEESRQNGERLGWTLRFNDGVVERYGADGGLLEIERPDGHALTLSSPDAYSRRLEDSAGTALTLQYFTSGENQGRLATIVDNSGQEVSYDYNSLGMVERATYADGQMREYRYGDTNGDGVTDDADLQGKGVRLLSSIHDQQSMVARWTYDDQGRAITSEHGDPGADTGAVAYDIPGPEQQQRGADFTAVDYSHQFDPQDPRVTVTNALGKQTIYHFAQRDDGSRRLLRLEGLASSDGLCAASSRNYSYNADGRIATRTDWSGNVTRFHYHPDGQLKEKIEAEGTPQERIWRYQWSQHYGRLYRKTLVGVHETTYQYSDSGRLQQVSTVSLRAAP